MITLFVILVNSEYVMSVVIVPAAFSPFHDHLHSSTATGLETLESCYL